MTKTEGALKESTTAVPCFLLGKCAGGGLLATNDVLQCLGASCFFPGARFSLMDYLSFC
jgi:hypothetical protein